MKRRPHSGQALVVMLAFMACLLGAFILVFNVGQVVNDKMKLTNAADAAAYSAALWEARSLNFQAYMNRAMVANEVAIAQLVSLRSWSAYVGRLTTNGARVSQFFPPVGRAMQALARSWNAVDRTVQQTMPPLEGALSRWNVDVLAHAQFAAHHQAELVAADLVNDVARANEPRAELTEATRVLQARNVGEWRNRFTATYARSGSNRKRYTDLLMESRDGFTRSRRNDIFGGVLVTTRKRGGTDLIGEDSWRGVDTLSLHFNLVLRDVEVPIGWGAAEKQRRPVNARGQHGGSLRTNPAASRRALRTLRPASGYRGAPEIRDVITPSRRDERKLAYTVALRLPRERIATADRLITAQGVMLPDGSHESVAPNFADDAQHALGSAELYFQRPQARTDGRREYPSLFNPYWQARLIATPTVERTLAAPWRGLGVDPYAVLR
jgi:hypothetical protein